MKTRRVQSVKKQSDAESVRRLRVLLGAIARSDGVCSMSDGETYVCSFCETPARECQRRRGLSCPEMIRQGTLLDVFRHTGTAAGNECLLCGAAITLREQELLTELCPRCREEVHAVHQQYYQTKERPV